MNGQPELTQGCLSNYEQFGTDSNIILQVLELQLVEQGRWKAIISDGDHFNQCILQSQINEYINSGQLKKNSIVQLINHRKAKSNQLQILIVSKLRVIAQSESQIGNPKSLQYQQNAIHENIPYQPTVKKEHIVTPQIHKLDQNLTQQVGQQTKEEQHFTPISALSNDMSDWVLKVRVIQKSDWKSWQNHNGAGKMFTCVLLDKNEDQIDATFFPPQNEEAYDQIQLHEIYIMQGGYIKQALPQFSISGCQYQINFGRRFQINQVFDDEEDFPLIGLKPVPLDQIDRCQKDQIIDIIAVVLDAGQIVHLQSRNGFPLAKREIIVIDETLRQTQITVWNEFTLHECFQKFGRGVILAAKFIKVQEYLGQKELTVDKYRTDLFINYNIPQTNKLQRWWEANGRSIQIQEKRIGDNTNFKLNTIAEIRHKWDNNTFSDQCQDFYHIFGIISKIGDIWERIAYPSCNNPQCSKQRIQMIQESIYQCFQCNEQIEFPNWRYKLDCTVTDFTGFIYTQMFEECAEQLLRIDINSLKQIYDQDKNQFQFILNKSIQQQVYIKIKANQRNGRTSFNIVRVRPPNYKELSILQTDEIANVLGIQEIN